MKKYKIKLLNVAHKQEGYLEKKSNAFLNYKKKNAGSANYTKYGKWYGMNGVYWCCEFVSWCFHKAYGDKVAKELLCGAFSASCGQLMNQFKAKGRWWQTRTPKSGDLVIFWNPDLKKTEHIGIVYKVADGRIYTVEGNTSADVGVIANGGGVARKSYTLSNSRILGYCRPDYDKPKLKAPKPTLRKGAKGESVKKLQKCLNKVNVTKIDVDGDYGSDTSMAVREFKMKHNLTNQDGTIYGKKCYKALKKVVK